MVRASVWLVANTSWYVVNFRQRLIRRLRSAGSDVVVLAPRDSYSGWFADEGIPHIDLRMNNAGTNPLEESVVLVRLMRLFKAQRPDVLLTFTPKVNIYGALAARWAGVPVIANISGLGSGFLKGGWIARTMMGLYRMALANADWVFFQNNDDLRLFLEAGLVKPEKAERLPGSGVDVDRFAPGSHARDGAGETSFVFLLVARMLRDKGVYEFVDAARLVRRDFPGTRFIMIGPNGAGNPSAIPREQLKAWEREGVVEYVGPVDDLIPHYHRADCVVLPSYREGMSRVLLEAASMARPVITTNVPGCRDVVEDGVTGLLCRVRDPVDLAAKMREMRRLSASRRAEMGRLAREKVVREFDEEIVIAKYIDRIGAVLGQAKGRRAPASDLA